MHQHKNTRKIVPEHHYAGADTSSYHVDIKERAILAE